MDNNNPLRSDPIDINQIRTSIPEGQGPGSVPTMIIQTSQDQTSQGRIKFLEKIVKTQLLFNMFLVMLLAVTIYMSLVMRVDILRFFNKKVAPTVSQQSVVAEKLDSSMRVVAAEPDITTPVYINKQGIDLDKVFQEGSTSARLTVTGKLKNEVIGFLPYWMIPKLDLIDTRAVTSISYFGLEVDGGGSIMKNDLSGKAIEGWYYLQQDKKLQNFFIKAKANNLKIYLTLKCFNQANIVALTTSAKARETFISNAIYLMNSKSFDGLNIDFEYIGTPPKGVREGFSTLITDLNRTMKKQYPNSVLTIDTFVDAASANRLNDVAVLAQNSDGLVIMGYDFHTPDSSTAGPVAPFEGSGLSLKSLLTAYLEKAPAKKLILAVPYYGYDWPVQAGKFAVAGVRQQVNILPYGEIADATRNANLQWDETAQVPWYSYLDSQTKQSRIVYFDNVRSLGVKYDFVKQKGMQGVAIWALGFDGKKTELNQMLVDKFTE